LISILLLSNKLATKKLSILGSTGSIGIQALDVVASAQQDFEIVALSANTSINLLEKQIKQFQPKLVAVMNKEKAQELKKRLSKSIKEKSKIPVVLHGLSGLIKAATHPESELVLTAIVGAIGIKPTYEAIKSGKDIALANKETLVAAGEKIMAAAKKYNVRIIPVDSEHSAIFQCLEGREIEEVEKIILTCSGGPFHGKSRKELENISPEQALKHPTWDMGAKISIDSATLINKGLEVIEAHYLFNLPAEQIDVVIHPQSIIHSMVQFKDGNIIAQLGMNDMRIPISYALYSPEKAFNNLPRLPFPSKNSNLLEPLTSLTFEKPDTKIFKGLALAYKALEKKGKAPAVYNDRNELAVKKFLNREISFLEIPELIEEAI